MTKQVKATTIVDAAQTDKPTELIPVIYVDKIINIGFGPVVSRLCLAMESGVGAYTPITTLVLPTPTLLEAMIVVLKTLQGNAEVKEGIFKGLDAIKEQINALNITNTVKF